MRRNVNRIKGLLTLALLVALALVGSGVALAEIQATALVNNVRQDGTIVGNAAGSFAMYEVAYPGDEASVVVSVNYWPPDPVTAQAFGVNVYGYNGFSGRAEPLSDGTPGALEFSYSAEDPTTLVLQVYNYGETAVSYGIVATGLPETTTATSEPTVSAVEPVAGAAAATENKAIAGTSAGNTGGGIQLHEFAYAGDDEQVTVELSFWPDEPSYSKAIGFIVYDPYGQVVATGEPTDEVAFRTASFSSSTAGTYCIQVYNYADGVTISYTIDIIR